MNATNAQSRRACCAAPSETHEGGDAGHGGHQRVTHATFSPPAPPGTKYTGPMHPQIVRDGPGSCPICGMALEPMMFERWAQSIANRSPNMWARSSTSAAIKALLRLSPKTAHRIADDGTEEDMPLDTLVVDKTGTLTQGRRVLVSSSSTLMIRRDSPLT